MSRRGETLATIKDVASLSGVAVSTVSRTINAHPDVSAETRAKVMAAVRELRYVPNISARDLVQTQAKHLGVVIRGAENTFYTPIVRAIGQRIDHAGYTMVIDQLEFDSDEVAAAAALAQSKRLRGVILLGGRFDYNPEDIASIGVPVICCTHANQFGSLDERCYSSVAIDDEATAFQATKKLIELGHKHIAVLLSATDDHSISELRYHGYCCALREAGLTVDENLVVHALDFSLEAAYSGIRTLIQNHPEVTALFAVSDSLGIAALKGLHDEGVIVPQEFSLIAIDGIELSYFAIPTLTTLVQPQIELGELAVDTLLSMLNKEDFTRHIRVETYLRKGGTIAPVAS